jgi:hypothetical protein
VREKRGKRKEREEREKEKKMRSKGRSREEQRRKKNKRGEPETTVVCADVQNSTTLFLIGVRITSSRQNIDLLSVCRSKIMEH